MYCIWECELVCPRIKFLLNLLDNLYFFICIHDVTPYKYTNQMSIALLEAILMNFGQGTQMSHFSILGLLSRLLDYIMYLSWKYKIENIVPFLGYTLGSLY